MAEVIQQPKDRKSLDDRAKMTELERLRHSAAHVMATAVARLWPDAQFAAGPAVENGFYYDVELEHRITPEDFPAIEAEMKKEIKANHVFEKKVATREQALADAQRGRLGALADRPVPSKFKISNLQDIPEGEPITYFRSGDFVDLCKGPHVESTGRIKTFKLLSIAGAYWHGIETNPMLQRIYGTCFEDRKELEGHLKNLEEAKLRDHRKLGPSLELFDIYHEEAGAGLVFYHPKGALLRTLIEDYEKQEHLKRGYQIVITPHIMSASLWKTSGHYDYYRDNMYIFKIDEQEYVLKPMNCPVHILIYK